MMYLCTSRFDIESEQYTLMEEYLTAQEIQAVKEKNKTEGLDDNVFDLISDTDEDPSAKALTSQALSRVALGKRPLRDIRDTPRIELGDEDDDVQVDEIPLPDNSNLRDGSGIQRRTSSRIPKRSKRDDGE
ncbi:hypothetical protein BDW66DRAFT_146604 [Aspergillus desertorum]